MNENIIDPAKCPACEGRLRVMSSRRSAGSVLTRYRQCPQCATRTVDRSRVTTTPIGRPRVIGGTRVSESADLAELHAATVPTSADRR